MSTIRDFTDLVDEAKKSIKELSLDEVYSRLSKPAPFFLIDIREDLEWKEGKIKGAIHIGKGVIERDIEDQVPDPNAELILYCGGGSRSALAAKTLMQMGYTSVTSMKDGYRGWVKKNYPVEP